MFRSDVYNYCLLQRGNGYYAKTVKTLNLAKKRILPNLAKKRILAKK